MPAFSVQRFPSPVEEGRPQDRVGVLEPRHFLTIP
jgi:hypothetical protein